MRIQIIDARPLSRDLTENRLTEQSEKRQSSTEAAWIGAPNA
jgi:hypothetical protein